MGGVVEATTWEEGRTGFTRVTAKVWEEGGTSHQGLLGSKNQEVSPTRKAATPRQEIGECLRQLSLYPVAFCDQPPCDPHPASR